MGPRKRKPESVMLKETAGQRSQGPYKFTCINYEYPNHMLMSLGGGAFIKIICGDEGGAPILVTVVLKEEAPQLAHSTVSLLCYVVAVNPHLTLVGASTII